MSASPSLSREASPIRVNAGAATQAQLQRDVFGGSDSELSEDEDAPAPPRLAFPPRKKQVDDDDEDEDEGEGSDQARGEESSDDEDDDGGVDAYVPATAESGAKIPKFKKKKRSVDDEGDGEGEGRVEKKKRKKKEVRERRVRERRRDDVEDGEEDEPVQIMDENDRKRMELEQRIDNIGKKTKQPRRKKKGDDEVDNIDGFHDELCVKLRDKMLAAALQDKQRNEQNKSAVAKLAMLDEVMAVLRNQTMWQGIVDNAVLDAVRAWLEPMDPSKALPAVGIQKAFFEVLPKMDLDTQTLKECRLGPIILFYTKTKRVTPLINRQADSLVQAWSRPIIKRPANFRSRHVQSQAEVLHDRERDGSGDVEVERPAPGAVRRNKRFDVGQAMKENEGRKGARLYIAKDIQYTVAPESKTNHVGDSQIQVNRIQSDNRRFNKFARQMKGRK